MSLAGKVALVTGAGAGIGRACAQMLSEEGVRVAIGYIENKDQAIETAALCAEASAIRVDVTSREEISAAFDEIERSIGPVEILVNNAGITRDRLFMRMSDEEWEQVLDVNLSGAFRCTKRALPGMLKAGWGRIVSIGSVVGTTGNAGQTNYAAAKAGLVGFTKSLSREVARKGITANVVAPGLIDTAMTEVLTEVQREALLNRVPVGRPGTTEEVAEAVRFCVRASYLSGQVIDINGGLT
ncbi:MAG: beta-ketoacyl-ACP reductase [Actinomycetota bacterium]